MVDQPPKDKLRQLHGVLISKYPDVPKDYDVFAKGMGDQAKAADLHKFLIGDGWTDIPQDYSAFSTALGLVKKKEDGVSGVGASNGTTSTKTGFGEWGGAVAPVEKTNGKQTANFVRSETGEVVTREEAVKTGVAFNDPGVNVPQDENIPVSKEPIIIPAEEENWLERGFRYMEGGEAPSPTYLFPESKPREIVHSSEITRQRAEFDILKYEKEKYDKFDPLPEADKQKIRQEHPEQVPDNETELFFKTQGNAGKLPEPDATFIESIDKPTDIEKKAIENLAGKDWDFQGKEKDMTRQLRIMQHDNPEHYNEFINRARLGGVSIRDEDKFSFLQSVLQGQAGTIANDVAFHDQEYKKVEAQIAPQLEELTKEGDALGEQIKQFEALATKQGGLSPEDMAAYQQAVDAKNKIGEEYNALTKPLNDIKSEGEKELAKYDGVEAEVKKLAGEFSGVVHRQEKQQQKDIDAALNFATSQGAMAQYAKDVAIGLNNFVVDKTKDLADFTTGGLLRISGAPIDARDKVSYFLSDFMDLSKTATRNTTFIDADGTYHWDNLPANLTTQAANMFTLIYGGVLLKPKLLALGLGKAAPSVGLFTSSYLQTYNSYYQHARQSGLDDIQSYRFASASSTLTSLSELISPNTALQRMLGGGGVEKITKNLAEGLVKGQSFKTAWKSATKTIPPELTQEFNQLLGDKLVELSANRIMDKDAFHTTVTLKEIAETAIYTTIITGLIGGVPGVMANQDAYNKLLVSGARDMPRVQAELDIMMGDGRVTQMQATEVMAKLQKIKVAFDKVPTNIPEEKRDKMAPLIEEKENIEAEKKAVDPVFHAEYDEKVKAIDEELKKLVDEIKIESDKTGEKPKDDLGEQAVEKEIGDILQKYDDGDDLLGLFDEHNIDPEKINAFFAKYKDEDGNINWEELLIDTGPKGFEPIILNLPTEVSDHIFKIANEKVKSKRDVPQGGSEVAPVGISTTATEELTSAQRTAAKEIDNEVAEVDRQIADAQRAHDDKKKDLSKRIGKEISEAPDMFGASKKAQALVSSEVKAERENIEKILQPFKDKIEALKKDREKLIAEKSRYVESARAQTDMFLGRNTEKIKESLKKINDILDEPGGGALGSTGNPRTIEKLARILPELVKVGLYRIQDMAKFLIEKGHNDLLPYLKDAYRKMRVDPKLDPDLLPKLQDDLEIDAANITPRQIKKLIPITPDEAILLNDQIRTIANAVVFAKGFQEARKQENGFAEKIKVFLKSNATLRGKVPMTQFRAIVNAAGRVHTKRSLQKFMDYTMKVLTRANYLNDLAIARKSGKQIKKMLKSKDRLSSRAANNVTVAREFLKVDPAKIEDIVEYNTMAEKIIKNLQGLRVEVGNEGSTVVNDEYQATNDEISTYTKEALAEIEAKEKQSLAEEYAELVDLGLIDPNTMSLKDMQDVIEAAEGGDVVFDDMLEGMAEGKEEQKRKAMQKYVDYKLMELKDRFDDEAMAELHPVERDAVKTLLDIDTSKLSLKEIVKLNDVINNIIQNNDFTGSGLMVGLAKAQQGVALLPGIFKRLKINLRNLPNWLANAVSSKEFLLEAITISNKAAAEIQRLSGISGIYDGHAKAKIAYNEMMERLTKLKKGMKNIDEAPNRFRQGIFANVLRGPDPGTLTDREEFVKQKEWVLESAKRLQESDLVPEQIEGKMLQEAYDELLEGATSADEVRLRMSADNLAVVDFFVQEFEKTADDFEVVSKVFGNKPFPRSKNYTNQDKKSYSNKKYVKEDDYDMFKTAFFGKGIETKAAGTAESRAAGVKLPSNVVLNLDFSRVQAQAYYKSVYDIETMASRVQTSEFFRNEGSKGVLGGSRNWDIMRTYTIGGVKMQMHKTPEMTAFEKGFTAAANALQAKGARMALGSITQLPKQYISVSANAVITLGKDAGLFWKAVMLGQNLAIFDNYNIGLRGETRAGYNKKEELDVPPHQAMENIEKGAQWVAKTGQKMADAAFATLVYSDVAAARHSWLAFYMKDLVNQGLDIDNIDFNDKEQYNDEAAAYAQHMVSRSQNPSDATGMADIYRGEGFRAVMINAAAPFNSFALNQRRRFFLDIKKIRFGSANDKRAGLQSLASMAAEQGIFNGMKTLLIGTLSIAAANGVLSLLGFDDDDRAEAKNQFKKWVANTTSDFFLSGIGTLPKFASEVVLNWAFRQLGAKDDFFFHYDPTKYGDRDFSMYGVYGVATTKIHEIYKQLGMLDGTTDKNTSIDGKTVGVETEMTKQETNLAWLIALIDVAALVGIGDAEINTINARMKGVQRKHMERDYGGTIKIKTMPESANKKRERMIKEGKIPPSRPSNSRYPAARIPRP